MFPKSDISIKSTKVYRTISIRPLNISQTEALGRWLTTCDWNIIMKDSLSTDSKLQTFRNAMNSKLDEIAPVKNIKIACDDPPWMDVRIKQLIRKRNREYDKNKKSMKWRELNKKCKSKCKNAKQNFANKFIKNLKDTDPKMWMQKMKILGKASYEKDDNFWKFANETLNDQDLAEDIAKYFADISSHFTPIIQEQTGTPLPLACFVSEVPCYPKEHELYQLLKETKKTCSVPNDLPIKIVKEYLPELITPISMIFNQSIAEGLYPTDWKMEVVIPHPKVFPPETYSDLRNISITEWLSKAFENFLLNGSSSVNGLLHYISKYYDPDQFATGGSSCTHALIKIIDFMLRNTDKDNPPKAVISLLADWSKAFNNCNHNIILRILQTMGVPHWLLRLIRSYLTERKMKVKFRGKFSNTMNMPGGTPQGTLLGVVLYILYINPIGYPGEITLQVGDTLTKYWEDLVLPERLPDSNEKLPESMQSTKYMDDATVQEVIELNKCLASNIDRSGPLPYWESSGKVLPNENCLLQTEIETMKTISDSREMHLNSKKTTIFITNFSKIHQFRHLLKIPGSQDTIELTFETKLLGYWFTSNLKPHKHVEEMLKTVYQRMWSISRLKSAGVSDEDILYFYCLKMRSVLEFVCPIFQPMLTKEQFERIQKIVFKVILSERYVSYENSCQLFEMNTLEERRENLSLRFALKCIKNGRLASLFPLNDIREDLRKQEKFVVPFAQTRRYQKTPVPYLASLLNEYFSKL